MTTLYDYIAKTSEEAGEFIEFTVYDKVYDFECYFYPDIIDGRTDWDKAMAQIAKKITVVEENDVSSRDDVTVNLSEVIEKNIKNGSLEKLFIINEIDAIMDDMDKVFAGYVSEPWLIEFAKSLM